jgi:septal ring factor EnvC (AmiA/AmiB activator)
MIILLSILTDTLSNSLEQTDLISNISKPQGMSVIEMVFYYGIAPTVTVFTTWLATTLRNKKVKRQSDLENVERAIKIWTDLVEKLETKLGDRENEIHALKVQLNEISVQNNILLTKLDQIEKDYRKLERNYNELKKELSK